MATENYVDFSAATTVASGGYTSGSGVLNVASTGSPFPSAGNFSVVITDQTTGLTKVLLRVSAKNSTTQWAVTAEGTDANANSGDNAYAVLSASGLDGVRGDINQMGTRANLPSTTGQKLGNRYKCTDSPYEFIFDGSAWRPFIFGYRVDEPLSANFSWTNQGSSTITTTNGGIVLKVPPNSGDSLRIQQQAVLSAPYTCDLAFLGAVYSPNFSDIGILLYDASGGKLCSFHIGNAANNSNSPFTLGVAHWTSTTSFSASANFLNGSATLAMNGQPGPLIWMRIYDDNTNRNFYISFDGIIFNLVFQETRTNFVTPTKIGFFIDMNNNATSMFGTMFAVHWNNYSGAPPTTGYSV